LRQQGIHRFAHASLGIIFLLANHLGLDVANYAGLAWSFSSNALI
jgi:hypothetical protein